LIYYEFLNRSI